MRRPTLSKWPDGMFSSACRLAWRRPTAAGLFRIWPTAGAVCLRGVGLLHNWMAYGVQNQTQFYASDVAPVLEQSPRSKVYVLIKRCVPL